MPNGSGAAVVLMATSLLASSCAIHSTFQTRSGESVHGAVIRSDPDTLLVRAESTDELVRLQKCDVIDHEHAGDGKETAGAVVLGSAVALAALGWLLILTEPESDGRYSAPPMGPPAGAIPIMLAVPTAVVGGLVLGIGSAQTHEAARRTGPMECRAQTAKAEFAR
jgi:hypothetical protein